MFLNKYYSKTLCIRSFTNLSLRIAPILLIFVGGCASNTNQYCGIEYSNSYDVAKCILPWPSEPTPTVVVPYTTKDLESNPYYYSPQPPLGCTER